MKELSLKCYAHLGDAVYEVFVREKIIYLTEKMSLMHKINTELVRASFQCELLEVIEKYLTDKEKDLVRRGRNLSSSKRNNPIQHKISTGFEVLIGYLYLHDKNRLEAIFNYISSYIGSKTLD